MTETVDIDLHGLLSIRLVNATPDAIDAVASLCGSAGPPRKGQATITVEFTDDEAPGNLRLVGLNEAAYDEEGFYVLDPLSGRALARVPLGEFGAGCTFTCFRGVDRCPLLLDALRLALLETDHVALHASAFEYRGVGVLVPGWAYGGKTEALLAFAREGARYIGDEWVLLSREGHAMLGIASPMTVQDWQLVQAPELLPRPRLTQRGFFATIGVLERLHELGARGRIGATFPFALLGRGLPRLRKQRALRLNPAAVFPDAELPARGKLQLVVLAESCAQSRTTVRSATAEEIGDRMVSSLAYERLELLRYYTAFQFAFPSARNALLERAEVRERALLREALLGAEAYVVSHPYPVEFDELFESIEPLIHVSTWQRSQLSA